MGEPAYNLVIVKGAKEDLVKFEKTALKTESEAFCVKQLIPLPDYLDEEDERSDEIRAFNNIIFGSQWVGAFSILIEKSDSFLSYYFNSKYTKAELDYIAIKFCNLQFTHVFVEYVVGYRSGVIEYEKGNRIFSLNIPEFPEENQNFDWQIASDIHTYLHIADFYHKFKFFLQNKPEALEKLRYTYNKKSTFFDFFPKSDYLRTEESFYDSLYRIERDLEKRELKHARETYYNFRTNTPDDQLLFIRQNFLPSAKKRRFIRATKKNQSIRIKISDDRHWWDNLDKLWKDELISNLLESPGYLEKKMSATEVFQEIEQSDTIINDIVNLEKLDISSKLLIDLTPVFYFKNIHDFHIQEPGYPAVDAIFLSMYPKHLRSKVRRLNIDGANLGDLTSLSDYINLEVFTGQCCRISSLNGIQKLTRLKEFTADQGNYFSDLNPLQGLGLTYLNIEGTPVTDISPLQDVKSLEKINLNFLEISDYSPLLHLPNLRELEDADVWLEEKIPKKIYTKVNQVMKRNNKIRPYSPHEYLPGGINPFELSNSNLDSKSDTKPEDNDSEEEGLPF